MKKVISVVLTLVLIICAISVINASAAVVTVDWTPADPSITEPYKEIIEPKFREKYDEIDTMVIFNVIRVKDDYALCYYYSSDYTEGDYFVRFGDYYETTDKIQKIFPSGLFFATLDGSEFYSLEEAYNNNLVNLSDFILADYCKSFGLIGSVTWFYDELTINDVAQIQLYAAKLDTLLIDLDDRVMDTNNDGEVNILDSAYLQLKLAKLI